MQSSLKAGRGTIQGRPEAKAAAGRRKGGNGVNLNLRAEMIPGLCVLIAGALITYFAKWLCRKPQNLPLVKLLGVGMAVIGALLIFLP